MDEHPGQVDVVRVDVAGLDQGLHLRHAEPPGHGHERVEVAGGGVEAKVAEPVPAGGPHQGDVGDEGGLQHVVHGFVPVPGGGREALDALGRGGDGHGAVGRVPPRQPAFGHHGADPGAGEERGDTGAAGAQPLGQGPLGGELDLELAGEVLPGELPVLPDVAGHHATHAPGLEQQPEPRAVDPAVVRDDLQVAGAGVEHGLDEDPGHPAQPEAPDGHGGSVVQPREGVQGVGDDDVHDAGC